MPFEPVLLGRLDRVFGYDGASRALPLVLCYSWLARLEDLMSKHVLDRPTVVTNALLTRAIVIKRRRFPQMESLLLQRRARNSTEGHRLLSFLRIARRQALSDRMMAK